MKLYRSERAKHGIMSTYNTLLKQWEIPIHEMDVDTRYGKTHVISAGNENLLPVILFHGVGDDSALMWIYNAKALAEHFRIYAVDTIGGPGKSRPDEHYNKDFDDVLWIDDILETLHVERAFFVGVSHGGYMVQLYKLVRSEKVIKAVAISSSVPSQGKNGSPMKTMMKIFLPEALFPTQKNTEKLIKKLSGEHAKAFLDKEEIMQHYHFLLRGFNNMAMGYHKVRSFTNAEIEQIRGDVLYLVGEEDPFQKLGGKEALLANNMNAIFYPNAGHGLNHELSEVINTKIIEYFQLSRKEW